MFRKITGFSRADNRNPDQGGSKAWAKKQNARRAVLRRLQHDARNAPAASRAQAENRAYQYRKDNGLG